MANSYNQGQGGAGGVAIFVKKNIKAKEVTLNNIRFEEMDYVAITIYGMKENLVIVGVYRRPGKVLKQGRIKKIIQEVKNCCNKEFGDNFEIILAGDFNAHHKKWNCFKTDGSHT